MVNGAWLVFLFLRGVSCCDHLDVGNNDLSYEGIRNSCGHSLCPFVFLSPSFIILGKTKFRNKFDSGKKYGLEFFTAAGMQLCTLMKVVKTTGRIQQLKPDNEELSLLASIG